MDFTYKAYESLLDLLHANDYHICTYCDHLNYDKCAILRHDVDVSLEKALEFARFEKSLSVRSTYFLLISSDFYNILSPKNTVIISALRELGHEIGLHFDEKKYTGQIPAALEKELKIMSDAFGFEIRAISMHRPSEETLAADYKFSGAVNSYSKTFFEEFKYLSDSRRYWREPVLDIVNSNRYNKLHILTHPLWYSENNLSASEICKQFVNSANHSCYRQMRENIRDFHEFMREDEIR